MMATLESVVISLNVDLGTATVSLDPDGTSTVHMRAAMMARKDVSGQISFVVHNAVVRNDGEDSFASVPL